MGTRKQSYEEYVNSKKKKQTYEEYVNSQNKKEDIAPVDEKWYQGWLKKSEGNVGQAVSATTVDAGSDAAIGFAGIVEKTADAFASIAPYLLYGSGTGFITTSQRERTEAMVNEAKEKTSEFVKKDLINEEELVAKYVLNPYEKWKGIDVEETSVLGHKSDSLVQSAGQMVGTVGASMIDPMLGTTLLGATAFGSESENALNNGATYDQAIVSAAITAGAEILSEKISNGISLGGKTLEDMIPMDKLTYNISNKLVRGLINVGVDATGEGFEEIVSGYLSAIGQKMTYMNEKEVKEIFSSEEALDSFLGGFILGGVSSTGKTVVDTVKGTDSLSGLSNTEKTVFDKVYEDTIAEREEGGKELTRSEKNKIYDEVMNSLERGDIDIDTIESTLGDYSKVTELEEQEKTLLERKAELKELSEHPKEDTDYSAAERELASVENQLTELEKQKTQLKNEASQQVRESVEGSRLAESYYERARKGENFTAEVSNYPEGQRKIIQEAIDSGILNNTRKTHEFVSFVARICGAKDITFHFSNNERIAKSGFAVEGKAVNGFVNNGEITLNINSKKALNTVVGHEITHILEGNAELYNELQTAVEKYAQTKGHYATKWETIQQLYEGKTEAEQKKELTADFVGEYLFTDSDFINNLHVEKPNVFQKIYNEIKYMLKMATAGSDEAKQLLEVQKKFEQAMQSDVKPIEDGTKYSMSSMGTTFFENPDISVDKFLEKENGEYKYKQTEGYKNYVEQCLNNMRQTREDFNEEEARAEIDSQIEGIVRVGAAAKRAGYDIADYVYDADGKKVDVSKTKDSKGRSLFSSLEPNSEYTTSHDVSTICDKRKNFAEIYDDIVRAEQEKGVPEGKRFFDKVDNYFVIHSIMAEKGLTQPCKQCYVESMRKNLTPMATAFRELITETDENNKSNKQLYHASGKNKGQQKVNNAKLRENVQKELANCKMTVDDLTVDMLTTADGLAELRIKAPLIYELFNSFYGQAKPKMPKKATPFRFGELTALLTDEKGNIKSKLVEKINSTGGFRLQSYSDFQLQNYTDVLQTLFEAGTLGLSGHAYTKVPAFLDATNGTNLKRNISIFMYKDGDTWKIDRNDSFPYTLDEIYDIVNADKSGNTGIIAVSQNEDMSAWIMANNMVAYGIPFHKSGIKMGTVRDTDVRTEDGRVIKGYKDIKDHTRQQVETWKTKTADHNAGTKVKNGINIYDFWDFNNEGNLSKQDLIVKNVKKYIDICEERGYYPKFKNYVMDNTKVLSNVLKYSQELGFASENATIDDISFEYRGYRIPYGYYKFLGDFSMFKPDGTASPHEVLSLKNYDFDEAERFFEDAEGIRRKEILQQFSNGEERERARNSGKTNEELEAEIKQKRQEVVNQVVGPTYSLGDETISHGDYSVYGEDIVAPVESVPTEGDIAPVESNPVAGESLTQKNAEKIRTIQAQIQGHKLTKDVTQKEFDEKIAKKETEYNSLKRKDTIKAMELQNQLTSLRTKRDSMLRTLDAKIERAQKRIENIEKASRAEKRRTMQEQYRKTFSDLIGDTSTWVDKRWGIQYQTNTLRRNLRDIVRDENGRRDIVKADAIYDELQGSVNRNEANKNREANAVKSVFRDMNINSAESTYIQMLGELRHNPDTTLTQDEVEDFYNNNSNRIDVDKVERAINEARVLYDSLYDRVNAALSEHGFKEIGYRKGYFPHFTDPKQNWLAKLLNWKVNNDEIPTDIAGLTEFFEPQRTWQSFDKHRTSDTTDYNFLKGLDNYVNGSLDWIYHIGDIQKHRAFENEIRYRHSSEAVQKQIDEYRNNPLLTAEEVESLISNVLREAKNPLNNFVTDMHTRTNILAGKKSSKDRNMESDFNRHAYSVMTNITNRITANQVAGSVSSALTNFIPITQSWGQVNPTSSLVGMRQTIRSYMNDDGVVAKSDFLTNRLATNEPLHKDAWDRIGSVVGGMMEIVDNFTSQTVWRSKYYENVRNGMTEEQAIRDADQFAENVIGGRSKGNMPTIFHAKNPVSKMLTAFQLEVANQYGYMFKDMPQDIEENAIGRLTRGYVSMFVGAYVYNVLYSSLTGRDAAFDPIGIIQELIGDLSDDDDDEEKVADAVGNFASNVADEIPFVGGLLGGGRIPISSALPYNASISDAYADVVAGDWKSVLDEMKKPLYYGVMPMGGGQLRKTMQGLAMFDEDLPVSGSYTKSGNLRFPVEDTFLNKLQAGVFGQYASGNAREYFDEDRSPLNEKQIQEYIELDAPIRDYWEYREGLKGLNTLNEKGDYIQSLDLPVAKKNILINNIANRETPIDMSKFTSEYDDFEEFDFAMKNPEKYKVLQEQGVSVKEYKDKYEQTAFMYTDDFDWASKYPDKYAISKAITSDVLEYKQYTDAIGKIEGEKDSSGKTISGTKKKNQAAYIFGLDLDDGQKAILYRSMFDSKADREKYDNYIKKYLNSRKDMSYQEKVEICEALSIPY